MSGKARIWIYSIIAHIIILVFFYLLFQVFHSTKSYTDLLWRVFPVIIAILGIIIAYLSYLNTKKWWYSYLISVILGFIVILFTIGFVAYLLTRAEHRAVIFLPVIVGGIQVVYLFGITIGTVLAAIIHRRKKGALEQTQ